MKRMWFVVLSLGCLLASNVYSQDIASSINDDFFYFDYDSIEITVSPLKALVFGTNIRVEIFWQETIENEIKTGKTVKIFSKEMQIYNETIIIIECDEISMLLFDDQAEIFNEKADEYFYIEIYSNNNLIKKFEDILIAASFGDE